MWRVTNSTEAAGFARRRENLASASGSSHRAQQLARPSPAFGLHRLGEPAPLQRLLGDLHAVNYVRSSAVVRVGEGGNAVRQIAALCGSRRTKTGGTVALG